MKEIYLAQKNADMTEGRGPMVTVAAFFDREVANQFIDHKPGVMGRKSPLGGWSKEKFGDWEVKPMKVYEDIQDFEHNNEEAIKKRALAKLTPEERKLLGLDYSFPKKS